MESWSVWDDTWNDKRREIRKEKFIKRMTHFIERVKNDEIEVSDTSLFPLHSKDPYYETKFAWIDHTERDTCLCCGG